MSKQRRRFTAELKIRAVLDALSEKQAPPRSRDGPTQENFTPASAASSPRSRGSPQFWCCRRSKREEHFTSTKKASKWLLSSGQAVPGDATIRGQGSVGPLSAEQAVLQEKGQQSG